MSHYKESHYRQVFHCDTNMFKVSPIIMQTFYIKSKQNEKSEAKGMNRSIFSRLTGQISPGQCIAPSRAPGSPRSWWRGPCTRRRGHHIMLRDIVKYCFKASLCLLVVFQLRILPSCYADCWADSRRRRLVLELPDADLTWLQLLDNKPHFTMGLWNSWEPVLFFSSHK